MITIKLDRQQLEAIQVYFLPYMAMLTETKVKDAELTGQELPWLKELIVLCNYEYVAGYIEQLKKTSTKKLTLELNQAEAVCFYYLLKQLPINVSLQWLNDLCNTIQDAIHEQVWE